MNPLDPADGSDENTAQPDARTRTVHAEHIDRRTFLVGAAALGGGLAGATAEPRTAAAETTTIASTRRASIIVVGAGLSGLAAAHELMRAGRDVVVLEARDQPGGRVRTSRQPFADGLYAEEGGLFLPAHHALLMRFCRDLELPLDPVGLRADGELYVVRGQRIALTRDGRRSWPVELTNDEIALGLDGMWKKYVGDLLRGLGDASAPSWPADSRWSRYDAMTAAQFLAERGASPGAVALLRAGYLDLLGDGIDGYSALLLLRDQALNQASAATFAIRGGNDRLPAALAARLGDRIRYRAPVVRIEPGESRAAVIVRRGDEVERLSVDRVVVTVPFSVLRRIEVAPALSLAKRTAIADLPYTSVARVYLQARERFWTSTHLPTSANTDLPIKWVFDATRTQPGRRGILECHTAGPPARALTAMSPSERVVSALADAERVYPGAAAHLEHGTSKCWDDDEWARGAYAWFRPGQMQSIMPAIARPEGRLHFAGEHTSPWCGWMEGALESGVRAAREILAAA